MTLGSILRLSRYDLAVLGEAALLALPLEIGLRCLSLDALLERASPTPTDVGAAFPGAPKRHGREGDRRPETITPARAALLIDRLGAFYPLKATCLKKSLVLLRILRRRGFPAELRLGVRRVDEKFSSHAWVECEGQVLLDDGSAGLFATLQFPITTRHTSITNSITNH